MATQLLHGDCLELMRTLPDGSVDAVVTDPPYCSGGRQQNGARSTTSKSARADTDWFNGDNMGTDTYLWFLREIGREALRLSTVGAPSYVFTDWRQYTTLVTAWESVGWTLRTVLVWDKAKGGALGSWWRSNHEFVAMFTKGQPRPLSSHSFFNTWTGTKPQGGSHPTEKPVALMRYLVASIMPADGVILDPFMGSGTTGVACVQEGRKFIGIEQDANYYAIAERRIAAAQPPLFAEVAD